MSGTDINIVGVDVLLSVRALNILGNQIIIMGCQVDIPTSRVEISGHYVEIRDGSGLLYSDPLSKDDCSEEISSDDEDPPLTPATDQQHYKAYWEYRPNAEPEPQTRSSSAYGQQKHQGRPSDWWQRNGAARKPTARNYQEGATRENSKRGRQQHKSRSQYEPLPEPKPKPSAKPKAKKPKAIMDFYELLGVSRWSSQADIGKAAKKKRIEVHPDRLKKEDTTPEELYRIDEQAKFVGFAADTLLDPAKRERYDNEYLRIY
ncbi:MAG: hypothetical protein Q9218_003518 [Villophora microphyllina]